MPNDTAKWQSADDRGSSLANETQSIFPEMFDPVTGSWTSLPVATVPRVYHSVALLLPDGSVWTAGSTPTRDTAELRTEIYKPDHFFSGVKAHNICKSIGGRLWEFDHYFNTRWCKHKRSFFSQITLCYTLL